MSLIAIIGMCISYCTVSHNLGCITYRNDISKCHKITDKTHVCIISIVVIWRCSRGFKVFASLAAFMSSDLLMTQLFKAIRAGKDFATWWTRNNVKILSVKTYKLSPSSVFFQLILVAEINPRSDQSFS